VNIASILGSVGFARSAAHVAAKHGVVGLTKAAALEHAADNIRVNSVGPAFTNTPLLDKDLEQEMLAQLAGLHALGRLGTSDEVAALVAFVASVDSSFVTGSYRLVDGDYTAQEPAADVSATVPCRCRAGGCDLPSGWTRGIRWGGHRRE
jgi:NAD(P)-dependent dehydrogenase (short-subunit alcohol dehydrogenase family)